MISVAIFGGGIAGLSAAHELSKIPNITVHLYEASDSLGGQAKSYRDENGNPSEISWRGYGGFYKNIFEIMKEIPSPTSKGKSVYDTELSMPIQFLFVKDIIRKCNYKNTKEPWEWWNSISYKEKLILLLYFLRITSCDKRSQYYTTINASKVIKSFCSNHTYSFLTSLIGPWIGIDPQRCSLWHYFNFFRMIQYPNISNPFHHNTIQECKEGLYNPSIVKEISCKSSNINWNQGSGDRWLVMRRPTSESWFNSWENLLKNRNIIIHKNCSLVSIIPKNKKVITSVVVKDDIDVVPGIDLSISNIIKHDYYIIATTPFSVDKIVQNSNNIIKNDSQLRMFQNLVKDGPHIQISFRIGFPQIIKLPQQYIAFILPDSEFNITLYFQNNIWYDDVFLGPNIKTLISGTACVSYNKGKLYSKTATECSFIEFKKEILYQIYRCDYFNDIISKSNDGNHISKFKIAHFEVWKGWHFRDGFIPFHQDYNEKKWVNSTNTDKWMPTTKTSFENLFLAGAHIKSSVDLYSMETACATGRDSAFEIIKRLVYNKKINVSNKSLMIYNINRPIIYNFLGKLDNLLYSFNLPNIIDISLIMILILVLYIYIRNKKKES